MIAYVHKDNKVLAVVNDVIDINDFDIIGLCDFVKGNTEDLIIVEESLNLNVGDNIYTTNLVDLTPKVKALKELEKLDLIVPRILEDIISQGSFMIHQSKLDVISRKQTLREVLS